MKYLGPGSTLKLYGGNGNGQSRSSKQEIYTVSPHEVLLLSFAPIIFTYDLDKFSISISVNELLKCLPNNI